MGWSKHHNKQSEEVAALKRGHTQKHPIEQNPDISTGSERQKNMCLFGETGWSSTVVLRYVWAVEPFLVHSYLVSPIQKQR